MRLIQFTPRDSGILTALVSISILGPCVQASPCTDMNLPIVWRMNNTYTCVIDPTPGALPRCDASGSNDKLAAIYSDTGAPYTGGSEGVNAVINVCSGTYDATISTGNKGSRRFGFDFSRLIAGTATADTPGWTAAIAGGSLNVRNLWYIPPGKTRADEYWFTTRLIGGFTGPDNVSYALRAEYLDSDAVPAAKPAQAGVNTPYNTTRVIVHHIPGPPETWAVYPDPTGGAAGAWTAEAFTLIKSTRNKAINAGQFKMPFFFTITMK